MDGRLSSQLRAAERNIRVASLCGLLVLAMVGMSYAAVPLYRIFCEVTGYDGTTQRASAAPDSVLGREMNIEFDANIAPGLPWTFAPAQRRLKVRLGEEAMAHYRAVNNAGHSVTGTAVFNVTPALAGRYFTKIQCFCFTEQTLEPGRAADMPVVFFVDPKLADDKNLASLTTITLSYTFYPLAPDKVSAGRSASAPDTVN
jgi:cytochrome c oxidase assembly protein subunit 11